MAQSEMKITNSSTFQHPLFATLNGKSVRIIAVGDVEGKSPCYLFVDTNGKSDWESVKQFNIIDPSCLPASETALRSLSESLRQTTTK
jgi:hypothetical protein